MTINFIETFNKDGQKLSIRHADRVLITEKAFTVTYRLKVDPSKKVNPCQQPPYALEEGQEEKYKEMRRLESTYESIDVWWKQYTKD